MDFNRNESFICPLWKAYCGPYYDSIKNKSQNQRKREIEGKEYIADDFISQKYAHLCRFFEMEDSVRIKQGIPGMSSSEPILGIIKLIFNLFN